MKNEMSSRSTRWLRDFLQKLPQPGQAAAAVGRGIAQCTRQGLAVLLSALMVMIPLMQGDALAQSSSLPGVEQPSAPAADSGQQASPAPPAQPQAQPLTAEQLDQLVAPIALYPDALVAQVLAAATYPTQVVEADRWRQAQGNASPEQIAAGADAHDWDASVKALTAFPAVLAQMDRNLQWTTDLGNAYYNQPQDVMDAVQAMRQKAQAAGQLRSTPQQTVSNNGGAITIVPANPAVVYVPVYNPWAVWGAPFPVYPGYYWAPPPGVFWGGLAIGFGIGIGIGLFAHWGWGWGHWGMGWGTHTVFFNHGAYFTRSATVINRGFSRPGGPPRSFGARGAYARPAGGFNRPVGSVNRPGAGYRAGAGVPRPGAGYRGAAGAPRPAGNYARAGVAPGRPGGPGYRSAAANNRPAGNYNRPGGAPRAAAAHAPVNHGPSAAAHGSHPAGGSHARASSHPSGGGHGGSHAAHSRG
jgi:hypothetical protein